ncbi:tripartite tricarboxylate transporter TctB family protein [Fulvimarina endophytica]|uniref:Tripartite tricarboxylate transporter TctB family protein n=1 Tax=Fulvimarina endophytica TaxID=2293836 RepID=A0A371X5D1_9HYPH|nr:tripartite tricarboxylate transporter TctB family protein [Fulvimarina endophytica]RFC64407.1 tripartite tricarboxylate transporter TctB family protein [Fulvimarina endophytica]
MGSLTRGGPIVAILLLAAISGLILSTFGAAFADLGDAFSPIFFPRIILTVLLALSVLNVVAELRASSAPRTFLWRPVIVLVIGLPIYVLAVDVVGFFLASVPMGAAMLLSLGIRRPTAFLGMPIAAAGTIVILFNHLLVMPLPASPFTWWF